MLEAELVARSYARWIAHGEPDFQAVRDDLRVIEAIEAAQGASV